MSKYFHIGFKCSRSSLCIPSNEACCQNFERVEAEFRSSCKKRRAELIARIKQLQDPAQSLEQDIEQRAEVEAMYEAESQKLRSARKVRTLRLSQVAGTRLKST